MFCSIPQSVRQKHEADGLLSPICWETCDLPLFSLLLSFSLSFPPYRITPLALPSSPVGRRREVSWGWFQTRPQKRLLGQTFHNPLSFSVLPSQSIYAPVGGWVLGLSLPVCLGGTFLRGFCVTAGVVCVCEYSSRRDTWWVEMSVSCVVAVCVVVVVPK